MSSIQVNPQNYQLKGSQGHQNQQLSSISKQGQSQKIKDIFEAMEKNFDQNFNLQIPKEIPKIQTEHISTQPSKQAIHSSRSSRKVKPMYSAVAKKQLPSNQNPNFQKFESNYQQGFETQKISSPSVEKKSKNFEGQQSESPQKSNKSSPYTKIMSRLHQSMISQSQSNQQYPTSIQNLQSQRHFANQEYSLNHTSRSPKALNYKELQQKIESALKKNSHYKANGIASRFTKTNLTSRTFNEFNSLLLSRFEEYEKNRQRQIQQKKAEIEERKQKQLKFHPKINKKSLQFVQQMGGHQPLQHRYEKILELKNKKIQQYEEQKKQKEEEEYKDFLEEFLKYQKSPEQSTRSYDQFYEEMFKWKQRSMRKAEEKRKMIEEQKLEETNNFKPKINKKSQKIIKDLTKSEKHLPIHEREIPAAKKFKSKIDEECTFKPKINKRKVK